MKFISICMAIGIVLSATTAAAQGTANGVLTGTIRDASGAVLPDATVTVRGTALIGGPRTVVAARDGRYRASALPPGSYEVEAAAPGFQPSRRTDIILGAGAVLDVDVILDIAGVRDIATVEARSPMVDVRSASAPVRITQELLFNLPIQRDVARLINLAPGVAADVSFGGSQASNALFVDGVSATDPVFQDPLIRFNHNWVQEVHIAALGAPAEYGGFTGVAANAILRSGSNRLAGLADYWTTRPEWVARNTDALSQALQQQFAPRRVLALWEGNGQLGGPVRRDRLWYFTGVQRQQQEDVPAGFNGPGVRDAREWTGIGKLTTALTSSTRLEGFLERGVRHTTAEGIGRFVPLESSDDVRKTQTSWNARLTWELGRVGLLEARHGGYDSDSIYNPHHPNTRSGPSPVIELTTGITTRSAFLYQDDRASNAATGATYSRYARGAGGTHDVKAGIEHEHVSAEQVFGYPGGRFLLAIDGDPFQVFMSPETASHGTTKRVSLFVQDTWTPLSRLTVSAGLRFDRNRGDVPSRSAVFATTPVAPRIGIAWDVADDHRTVVRAHYGRYHDAIFASRIMQADPTAVTDSSSALIVGGQLVSLSTTAGAPPLAIDDDLKHSHVDQYVVGVDHELRRDLAITAQYIRRRFGNFMGLIDVGSAYSPVQRRDPGPDNRVGTADDGELITIYSLTNPGARSELYTNPDEAFNRYDAIQFIGRKRFADLWQMQSSYTRSRNEGTVGNKWHVNAARFDLGSPGRFVNPNWFINAFGRASFDPTHEAKVLGSVRLPQWGGATVSGVYRYTTGQAWGRRVRFAGLPQGQEVVRIEPQGVRRTPAINRLDLRVEKTFRVRGQATAGVFVDAFNVGNQGVPNAEVTNPINDFAGAAFGNPSAWTDPRMLRAAVRVSF